MNKNDLCGTRSSSRPLTPQELNPYTTPVIKPGIIMEPMTEQPRALNNPPKLLKELQGYVKQTLLKVMNQS